MKKVFAALIAVFALAASAETINLGQTGCNSYCSCGVVPNDGGLTISETSWFWAYAGVPYILDMTINGDHYIAADRAGDPAAGVWLYGPAGEQVFATINFHRWATKAGGGRAHYYIQHWEVLSGTLVR